MRHFSNKQIADILFEMSALYDMKDIPFKPRAYDRAAHVIESLPEQVYDLYKKGGEKAMDAIPGVGAGITEHLKALFTNGHFKEYEAMKKHEPVNILELTSIEGIGPQTVKMLWHTMKIKNMNDLERAAKSGALAKLPRFGARSAERILKAIEIRRATTRRFPRAEILPEVNRLETALGKMSEVQELAVAGSVRRMEKTIGDIDILAVSDAPRKVTKRFLSLPSVAHVYATGPTKTLVRLKTGVDADLRIVPKKSWGAAILYFTGNKAHNIALRSIAIKMGLKLNEYGLFKGKKMLAGATEEEIYKTLGLSYIKPEKRLATGEIEAAKLADTK
mgnify:CR=1 FL=1